MFDLDRLGDILTGGNVPGMDSKPSVIDAWNQVGVAPGILDGLDQLGVMQLLTDVGFDPAQFDLSGFAGSIAGNAGGVLAELGALMGQRDH